MVNSLDCRIFALLARETGIFLLSNYHSYLKKSALTNTLLELCLSKTQLKTRMDNLRLRSGGVSLSLWPLSEDGISTS